MRDALIYLTGFFVTFGAMTLGMKACDHELEQNEIKNLQWVEDANNGKPYTNYGAE